MAIKVVKLGGSMISKDPVSMFDIKYLFDLKALILKQYGYDSTKFMLVAGGGSVMRKYRDLLMEGGITNERNIHWVGTAVNVLHAMILKSVFDASCDEEVLKFEDYYKDEPLTIENVVKVGGGGRPGHSGDVDTVISAKRLGSDVVFSLKNVDGVYDSDPNKNPTAKHLDKLTWDEYMDVIGHPTEHTPGANYPIDPIASNMAKEAGIEFIVLHGGDLQNFEKALKGEPFIGTIIK